MKVYKIKTNQYVYTIDLLFKDNLAIVNYLSKDFGEENVRHSDVMKTILVNDINNSNDVYYEIVEVNVIE